ncbi:MULTISPECIES: TA system VapC family ribonuclease toxin [Acidithiobacillus]|uniref:Ribonuclease VapC n=1 Tax=Acidithiobacillus thiooxidans ATCC 19377 TaxID=637390 RepID=A0A5P9XS16_ACITH|nr:MULTISPECIES: TA system VapC family ribonuclease toxin [Acidithiobacillus]MBE7564333.1 PIN domain-containing protein [Acidithiobacillus sp. HP-6]MBE7566932.1 PIN domain-containing protein [Acidithiobacillus sp. HP-11]MBE7570673.1 PIN domain-containing protein [Acidithiobacillus sp. HP-2]MBU2741416.1 PIN domain-containing protein [Acidithiobacillus albertensis]MBU2751855.1 PIN domain-containing protein [Acidithiobacillus thiooxidans]
MRALLDVNVLIALLDAAHIHHRAAHHWLAQQSDGWATCPITVNGCLRILSQPGYPGALPIADIAGRLTDATDSRSHAFWPDSLDLLHNNSLDWTKVIGHRQITDVYLLALAVDHDGCFATFDRRIQHKVLHSAREEHLIMIPGR